MIKSFVIRTKFVLTFNWTGSLFQIEIKIMFDFIYNKQSKKKCFAVFKTEHIS